MNIETIVGLLFLVMAVILSIYGVMKLAIDRFMCRVHFKNEKVVQILTILWLSCLFVSLIIVG